MLSSSARAGVWLAAVCLAAACTSSTPAPTAEIPIFPTATQFGSSTDPNATPPAWAQLNLSGRLIVTLGNQGIQSVDLSTGAVRTVFTQPRDGWLTASSATDDGAWLALAYAPPPPEGEVQLGYTSLYLLPGECVRRAQPCGAEDLVPAVVRDEPHEAYFAPVWTPTGDYLYFAHFTPSSSDTSSPFKYTLERIALAGGQLIGSPEAVLDDALWPAISGDGGRLVYVYSDPETYTDYLRLASTSGGQAVNLVGPESFDAVDAPFFSPDGSKVYFSAVGPGPGAGRPPALARLPAWLDWLLGVQPAEAHNVPSDWWVMSVDGGAPTRLTEVYDMGMFGDIAPDGEHIAYISATGLYLMGADGSGLQRLLNISGFGTLEWLKE
jgi:hypothetical protein